MGSIYLQFNASPIENIAKMAQGNFLTEKAAVELKNLRNEHIGMKTIFCLTITIATVALSVIFGGFIGNVLGIFTIVPLGIWLGYLSKYKDIKTSYSEELDKTKAIYRQIISYYDDIRKQLVANMINLYHNADGGHESQVDPKYIISLKSSSQENHDSLVRQKAEELMKENVGDYFNLKSMTESIRHQLVFPFKMDPKIIRDLKIALIQFLKPGSKYLVRENFKEGSTWKENIINVDNI